MFECLICDILLDSASTLSKHNLEYHGIAEYKETFKCTVCLEEFDAEDTLFMHFKAKHVSREVKTAKEIEAVGGSSINSEEPFFDFIEEEVDQECKESSTNSEINETTKNCDEVVEVTKEVMEITKEVIQVEGEAIKQEPNEQQEKVENEHFQEILNVNSDINEVTETSNEVVEVTKDVMEVTTEVIEIEGEVIKADPDEQQEEVENEHFQELLNVKLEPEIEIKVEPVTLVPELWNPSTNENQYYNCQYCPDYSAQTKLELHYHLLFVHLEVKLDCQICSRSCKDLKELKNHMVNDHGQHDHEFECHICHRRYEAISRFKDHMIESHSKIDWHCDICGVAKKSRGAIWHHKKIDHQMDLSKKVINKKRIIPCNICEKVFKTKDGLKKHLKKHKKSVKTIKLTKPHVINPYVGKKQSKAKIDQAKRNIFDTHESDESVQVDVEKISDDEQSGQADQGQGHLNKPKMIKLSKPKIIKLIKPKMENSDHDQESRDQGITKKSYACKVCKKQFSMESKLHLHTKSKHANNKVKEVPKIKTEPIEDICLYCHVQVDDLETHYIVQHLNIKLQCRIDNCQDDFSSFWPMEYHMKDKHGFKRFYCTLCYNAFDNPKSLRNHLLGSHLDLKTCDKCDQFFNLDTDLIKHQRTHTNAIQSMIENKENFLQTKTPTCQLCQKVFKTKKDKINHYLVVHLNMNLDCKLCDLKFNDFVTSRRHQDQKHLIKPVCQLCNKKFPRTHRLLEHLMHDHLGIKYTCQVCCKQFSRQDYYEVHVGMHQKNDANVQSKDNDLILID